MAFRFPLAHQDQTVAAVRRLSGADLDAATLFRRVAHALHRAVPCDLYAAATIDPASNLITQGFAGVPRDSEQGRSVNPVWFDRYYFAETFDQTLALVQQRRWAATIGEATGGRLERSLCYRAAGSPPFSPEEVALVQRVAPDIAAGLRHAALRARAAPEAEDEAAPGVLIVDARGRVTATAASERLLAGLGELPPGWRESGELPIPVRVILAALESASTSSMDAEPRLRVRARGGRWLTLHAARSEPTETRPPERIVVITPSRPHEVAWLGLTAYDLSPREEEVVRLVVGGQSTRQIADRLFIAEHTVQRHLSNIFEKVGVRGRRALVKHLFVEQVLPGMA
jgi:DNA-binding CsgD family transcriptional regulator